MPKYSCKTVNGSGETLTLVCESQSLPELAAKFEAKGTKIETAREIVDNAPRIKGIPFFEITTLYRQIASSIAAGLPLVETLDLLSSESRNLRLKALLRFLRVKVNEGEPFSDAMALMPGVFPRVHVAAVRAGEESGQLEKALDDLASQAEAFSNMNRRFASSLVYPMVIAIAALGLFIFGFLAIVPKFKTLFGDLGVIEYPTVTQFIFFMAGKTLLLTILLLLGIFIMSGIILTQRKAAVGRLRLDSWKLKIPAIGQILEKATLARFTGTLGLLLESGVDLPKAIRLAAEGAGNRTVEQLLKNISAEVELGNSLSDAITDTGAMPPTLAWRVGVGEETGNLGDSLCRLSRLYADQVESLVLSLSGLIEPVLIIILGCGVAMLVLGMFMPLVSIIQNLTGCGM